MAPNNSSTGGYLLPGTTQGLPGGLTLTQFIQTVLVGISGLAGTLVRPRWQVAPPKQPDLATNWMAFAVVRQTPDTFAYVDSKPDGSSDFRRQEGIEVQCSFYGPDAMELAGELRDGFQIQQNLEALRAANMGFVETQQPLHVPDLVNERWINRIEMSVFLNRQVQRAYPIVTLLSANGTIHTVVGNEEYLLNWRTPEVL